MPEPGRSLFRQEPQREPYYDPTENKPAPVLDLSQRFDATNFSCRTGRPWADAQELVVYLVGGSSPEEAVGHVLVVAPAPAWYERFLLDLTGVIDPLPAGLSFGRVAQWLCAAYSPDPDDNHWQDGFSCDAHCRFAMSMHDKMVLNSSVFDAHRGVHGEGPA